MINRILVCATVVFLVMSQTALGASTKKVQDKMKEAIATESLAQSKADDWNVNKEDLVGEIRELQTRMTWLKYQKVKHKIYVQGIKDNIAQLEARKLEARKLRENLEPYLEEVAIRLEAFVAEDMPFLAGERQQRLYFLKNTMNDYHLDLGEKLRRVFETLGVETTYGKMVTASDETLSIDGSDTEVTIFRLGRMAMFYRTIDGEKIGRWNVQSRQWEPMDKDFAREIRRALEISRRERSVELIQLPVGAVTP